MVRDGLLGGLLVAAWAVPAFGAPAWPAAGGPIFAQASADPSPDGAKTRDAGTQAPAPAQPFAASIEAAAARHGLDPRLLRALVVVESQYRPEAVSPAGAGGLTQLMPATARDLGVDDRFDPDANLMGGAAFLARQIARFQDIRLALAAYNAGPERVLRRGGIPAIGETRQYVARVVDCYLAVAAGRAVRSVGDCPSVTP